MQRKHWDTPRTLLQLATTCVFRSKYICSKTKCPTVLKLQPPYLDNTIIRDMVLSLSLIHLRMTDCTTNFHTRYLFLPHDTHSIPLMPLQRKVCVHLWSGFARGLYRSWSRKPLQTLCVQIHLSCNGELRFQAIKGVGDASRTCINMHESGNWPMM